MTLFKSVFTNNPATAIKMSLVDLGKRLLDSAKRGETDEVRTLMSNGAPFTTDWLGTSPLHFSAQYGHISTAEVLLRAGISRDARTKVDRTPLHVASQEGHVEIVNLLLQHSADIDAKDMLKMTPLHWATEKGNLIVIETLLKAGADVTCENKFERTPLDIAIINGRPDIVQTIQLAQHTSVGGLQDQEPEETVTVETSEVVAEDTTIIAGEDNLIEAHHMANHLVDDTDGTEDGNSTSVLATLAALAEATAQTSSTSTSTSEAINWLESQGITMISTTDGNIITSAVESGQTITLTEAGKIALNIIKQQGLTTDEEGLTQVTDEDKQDVMTYVSEGGDIQTDDTGLHIQSVTTMAPQHGDMIIQEVSELDDEPAAKRVKYDDTVEEHVETTEIDVDSMLQKNGAGDAVCTDDDVTDQDKLKQELEDIKRQAEQFKEQLKQKDKDLEQYKKQLGEIPDNYEDIKSEDLDP